MSATRCVASLWVLQLPLAPAWVHWRLLFLPQRKPRRLHLHPQFQFLHKHTLLRLHLLRLSLLRQELPRQPTLTLTTRPITLECCRHTVSRPPFTP